MTSLTLFASSGIDTALDLTFLFISRGPEVGVGEFVGAHLRSFICRPVSWQFEQFIV